MNLYKLGIKIFVANPAVVDIRNFVPIFQRWIQQQNVPGHLLIDVHGYSHVHEGPGILLVAHEGNFSMDQGDGQLGLVYYRKQPVPDSLKTVVETAQTACRLLEAEPTLRGIKFKSDEFLIFSNDRLLAPNTPSARSECETLIKEALGDMAVSLAPQAADTRERLAFSVRRG